MFRGTLFARALTKDILESRTLTRAINKNGFVRLVDVMPRLIPESASGGDSVIANAARVSYGDGMTDESNDAQDRRLIRHLMRHAHTSPFEMAEVKFHVKAPIFVARQWLRHRTASVNEWSGRYSPMPSEFYRPAVARLQSPTNMQGSRMDGSPVSSDSSKLLSEYLDDSEALAGKYNELIAKHGIAREQARIGLPVSIYTQFYWKCDLHNLLHFLKLRMAPDAQLEIQEYGHAIFDMIEPLFPITCEAFRDYRLNSISLTDCDRRALDILRAEGLTVAKESFGNKREANEFEAKVRELRLLCWDQY